MSKLSDEKLKKLDSLNNQGGFWYITKQNLVFRDLCFMAKILEAWDDRSDENYQSFFDRHKTLPNYGNLAPLTAHRATKNCEYVGLTKPSDKYSSLNLTPFYFALKDLCNGNFDNLSSYPNIVNEQLERIFIDSNVNNTYTSNIKICPFMFLFKILLLIGDITESYKITTSEFKLFVATAQSWNDYFEVVESILRYRNDNEFKKLCDANNTKVSDVRYNILAQNHSQLEVTSSDIAIKDGEVKNIRRKVAEYELNDSVQSAEDMFSSCFVSAFPLQQIFYGAPGAGKSNTIKRDVDDKGLPNERITFHPDSDYSTFVGSYKPKVIDVPVLSIIGEKAVETGRTEKKIIYEFVPQAFLKAYTGAWKNQKTPFFLIIEEINRGNCAQIFGDIFQLLDRKDGVSVYPITPDEDIQKFLQTDEKIGFASLTEEQKVGIPTEILSGELMRLPKNLHIWATMNTSDQSLFPIDSAFKRRWDWKYIKIGEGRDSETGELLKWTVKFNYNEDDKQYSFECSWWEFIKVINEKIASATSSDDKKLGYFFCKPEERSSTAIDEERFVGKVVFYLWNDVFKDEDNAIFKVNDSKGEPSFDEFYKEDEKGDTVVDTSALRIFLHNVFGEKKELYKETSLS